MSFGDLPFSMARGTRNPPEEHRALMSCLLDARRDHFRPDKVSEALRFLLRGPGLAGGDPYEWELCRWSERESARDCDNHMVAKAQDFVAWCDPEDFGHVHFCQVYSEEAFKRILEHAFIVWAEQEPSRKAEFASALAEYEMKLTL